MQIIYQLSAWSIAHFLSLSLDKSTFPDMLKMDGLSL